MTSWDVDLQIGQVWVDPVREVAYRITGLGTSIVYYRTNEDNWVNVFPTSRIQWIFDVLNARLLPGSVPDESDERA